MEKTHTKTLEDQDLPQSKNTNNKFGSLNKSQPGISALIPWQNSRFNICRFMTMDMIEIKQLDSGMRGYTPDLGSIYSYMPWA